MNILFLTAGTNINIHLEAHFSIYSLLTQGKKINTINVVTDNPVFYNDLKPHLNIIEIDEKTLQDWKGEHEFFWRIKIKAIEKICNLYPNSPVIYLDADTFLYTNIDILTNTILEGNAVMHEDEGALSRLKGKTLSKMWRQVGNKKYSGVKILPSHSMWNAGVVGTPNQKNNKESMLALAICDEMCNQGITPRLIEQFALAVTLTELYGLKQADSSIAHYWSNKNEWHRIIKDYFISAQFKSFTTANIIEHIKTFDFRKAPVKIKQRNTNERLTSLVERMFPSKDILFVDNGLQ